MVEELLERIAKLDYSHAYALGAVIFASLSESTSIAYQYEQSDFSGIPKDLIWYCDQLDSDDHLALVQGIAKQTVIYSSQ